MKPRKINNAQGRLFENRLSEILNPIHEFFQLAQMIDWSFYEKEFGSFYSDQDIQQHITQGSNYGVFGGCGELIIVDADAP
jgi:hypothetical protein